MWVAFLAFIVAIVLGLYQVANRSGFFPAIESHELYFASVSTHGVLMGFVLTTFFIMGFGYYTATAALKRPLWSKPLAWLAFVVALGGTVMAAIPLLTGKASVLYTFYPPLKADPLFYIGATLLVVGSWIWCLRDDHVGGHLEAGQPGQGRPAGHVRHHRQRHHVAVDQRRGGPGDAVPADSLVAGLIDTVDPGLARTLFSWTLHAIVYFLAVPGLHRHVHHLAQGRRWAAVQ